GLNYHGICTRIVKCSCRYIKGRGSRLKVQVNCSCAVIWSGQAIINSVVPVTQSSGCDSHMSVYILANFKLCGNIEIRDIDPGDDNTSIGATTPRYSRTTESTSPTTTTTAVVCPRLSTTAKSYTIPTVSAT